MYGRRHPLVTLAKYARRGPGRAVGRGTSAAGYARPVEETSMASSRRARSRSKSTPGRRAPASRRRVRGGATTDGFIGQTINASAIVAVGDLNLVKQTIATTAAGATGVGSEFG